jgi:leucyl-tRNA synthetase
MEYQPRVIEKKWRENWVKEDIYKVEEIASKPKYYVLDMFPYPSGAGLHVGHPLGYIASDIFSRYKRMSGFNVLHPMGYDAFGLPAEQYAIQTGVHPAHSTAKNIERYREQLDNLGFSFDWSREVRTCDPSYYKWTQWIFLKLFNSYYDTKDQKAKPIKELITHFEQKGSNGIAAFGTPPPAFTASEWAAWPPSEKDQILMNYRLAYRKTTYVNWCEALGTVLANDEVKDGVSERGGYPVERKPMLQWSLRITAYAERLLNDLESLEWSEAMKKMQANWIGRSQGAQLFFDVQNHDQPIEIYTTRPDTIFGATFMVLAPEHELVEQITTTEQQNEVDSYLEYVNKRSERERMAETKEVTGAFTGAHAINPFNQKLIPVYISEYVLKDYGTGAIMAVPADDERDQRFAKKFGLEILPVVDKSKYPGASLDDKVGILINSDFLNGLEVPDAIEKVTQNIEEIKIGRRQINYKLRDAIYSRQRYWGEPFPVKYDKDGVTHPLKEEELPLELPNLEDFKPASGNKSPLARLSDWVETTDGMVRETDTMPGFAGSSWYFLRYMDPHNSNFFADRGAVNYWREVDLYVGGTEHAVGHLMYSRFWHKFLFDNGWVPTSEPFKKLINQGMIGGTMLYIQEAVFSPKDRPKHLVKVWTSDLEHQTITGNWDKLGEGTIRPVTKRLIPLALGKEVAVDGVGEWRLYQKNLLNAHNIDASGWAYLSGFLDREDVFLWKTKEGEEPYLELTFEIGKMSKSKYNVINPDDVVENYGADCFRMYEMFLGPVEQAKPWDTKGIDGVSKFLRKYWSLFFSQNNEFVLESETGTKEELKVLHSTVKKVKEDIERFSFNTCISAFMVAVNELRKLNCNKAEILLPLTRLMAPFAPHISEEIWSLAGQRGSIHLEDYPAFNEEYLVEDSINYPLSINGKKRGTLDLPAGLDKESIEKAVMQTDVVQKWTEGKEIVKVIVVPGRMVNVVVKG